MTETRCSFCGRTPSVAGPVIVSKLPGAAAICRSCLEICDGPDAYVVSCVGCDPENGRHGEMCPEVRRLA